MTPVVVRRERIIAIPADVIWQLVEPVDALPAWWPLAERSSQVSGQGLGRRQRTTLRLRGGGTTQIDQEITVYQPNVRVTWRDLATSDGRGLDVADASLSVSIEPSGPGARVSLEWKGTPATNLSALKHRLFERPRLRRALGLALDRLAGAGA